MKKSILASGIEEEEIKAVSDCSVTCHVGAVPVRCSKPLFLPQKRFKIYEKNSILASGYWRRRNKRGFRSFEIRLDNNRTKNEAF
jgi:hypothetical protein